MQSGLTIRDVPARAATSVVALCCALAAACSSDTRAPAAPGHGSPEASTDAGEPTITTTQFTVGNLVFDARVAGPEDGTVVILLHGFPETSYEWRHQLVALARAGYRAVAPDQRGYSPGARPTAVADYSVVLLAEDVIGIADAVGAKRFHVVGHDWGGGVLWTVARLYADRVITASSLSTPHPDALIHELADQTSCQYQASSYFDFFTSPTAEDFFLANDNQALRATYQDFSAEDADVYVAALGNRPALTAALNWYRANITNRQFNVPSLGMVTVPSMLVAGEADQFFCKATVDLTAASVSGPYRLEMLPGVNHWVPEVAPDRVNELLLDQMRTHAGD